MSAIAIGFFDGVHRGHQAILAAAKASGEKVTVLTFANHPLSVLAPARAPALLQTAAGRRAKLLEFGADEVEMLDFTPETARESAEDFACGLVRRFGGNVKIFCGEDWRFGAGGKGDAAFLEKLGLDATTIPAVMDSGAAIHSTRIRQALAEGDVATANRLLGYACRAEGPLRRGKGLGRTIGRPTLNIEIAAPALKLGVYAVSTPFGRAVANYGLAPTAGEMAWQSPVLEVHLLENAPPPDPPGEIAVELLAFIRPERKFADLAALREQIERDAAQALAFRRPGRYLA